MSRKLFAAALFALACTVTLYASSASGVDEAPPPRAVGEGDKKPGGKAGFDKGKFGGFGKGQFDPEKLKELKGKFGGKFDPEKFKEFKGKFGKEGFPGKGGFPGGGKGGFGKGKKGDKDE